MIVWLMVCGWLVNELVDPCLDGRVGWLVGLIVGRFTGLWFS